MYSKKVFSMKNSPDVSIVIPNFNCLKFLPTCIESIRSQKGVDYEIIVIDDGSTDGSLEWLNRESENDERLKVYAEKGLGAGSARNLAVQLCSAELVAFLDADDFWTEGKLAKQVAYHQQNESVVLSFSDYEHIEEESGEGIIGCFEFWPRFSAIAATTESCGYKRLTNPCGTIFAENVVGTSSVMIRKSAFLAVSGFDSSLNSASDWDLWLKLAQIGDVAFTKEKAMGYLIRAGSMTSNKGNRIKAMETIVERHAVAATDEFGGAFSFAKARLADGYREMYIAQRQPLRSLQYSIKALCHVPSSTHVKSVLSDVVQLFKGKPATR